MHDLLPQNKLFFWALWIILISLFMVPSVVLLESAQQYWRFLSAWEPGTLQSVKFHGIPHRGVPADHQEMPEMRFVEFRFKVPKAKKVYLAGDFNHWKPETLPLFQKGKKDWEVLVPLPPGKYEYAFQVDGAWAMDPKCPVTGKHGDIKTCVRQVQ